MRVTLLSLNRDGTWLQEAALRNVESRERGLAWAKGQIDALLLARRLGASLDVVRCVTTFDPITPGPDQEGWAWVKTVDPGDT